VPEHTFNENFSDSDEESIVTMSNNQCKRKSKMERKEAIFVPFDIDSIIQKVHVPVETQKIVSSKRYFSLRKNNQKNNNIIKISRKLLKSGENSPMRSS
jgi:hypothetical protein